MQTEPSYYEVIGLPRTASAREIEQRCLELAQTVRPDIYSDNTAKARFELLELAFDTLTDPAKRDAYDARMDVAPASTINAGPDISESIGQSPPFAGFGLVLGLGVVVLLYFFVLEFFSLSQFDKLRLIGAILIPGAFVAGLVVYRKGQKEVGAVILVLSACGVLGMAISTKSHNSLNEAVAEAKEMRASEKEYAQKRAVARELAKEYDRIYGK